MEAPSLRKTNSWDGRGRSHENGRSVLEYEEESVNTPVVGHFSLKALTYKAPGLQLK